MTETRENSQGAEDGATHEAEAPASSKSKHAKALRSARALQEGLLRLLRQKPFDQITVRDICAEAQVHYATFFRHHQTRESLLDAVAKDEIASLNRLTLSIRGADDYDAGFQALCAYVDDHRSIWSTLLNGGAGGAMREEWLRQSRLVAQNEKSLNSWLPRELGTICAATLIAETLAWWVEQPEGAYSVAEVARILQRLLATSIMAPD
ncbi:helix-turn-helix domain-containing protein [Novosphingobium sp. BL-8A]|uniref:TetR/AcrR family transcriptional regulator n=1 Tax=Novosphingobium sp. BL-8A TaxID=3127639 RepID=UPI00375647FD